MKLKENDNVPEIRFDYFKEEWDRKRFKDFTKLSQGLQIAISSRFLEDGEHRYFYITNEFLNPNSTKKYYIESPSENVICTVDDILMTRTGNTGKVITNISGAFHNNFFKVDYDKFETSKMFLYYLLTSNDIQKEIIIRAGNSTIPDLNHSDFYSIKTSVPALAEQTAIGSLFRTLDDLMSSYKDNLANYQSLKASMLSKMFPKAGQTVPEIRLDGFEGDWELIKLGEVCDLITKGTTAKSQSEQGKVNFIKVENLKDNEIYSGVKISEEEHLGTLKRSILYEGDILFSIAGTLGRTAIVRNDILPANTNQALAIIRGYKLDAYFLLVVLSGEVVKDYIRKNPTVGAQPNLSLEQVSSLKIQVPSIKEQQAIGAYFSNLDNLINSYREKNSQLETLKKKLLQDMFI